MPPPISPEPLQAETFAQFGSVIDKSGPFEAANQGSARKFLDVVKPENLYSLVPSRKWAKAVVNLFSCSPRDITFTSASSSTVLTASQQTETSDGVYPITILERHPFTSQTFIPIGLSAETSSSKYLVIVAPTLPASESRKLTPRPPPFPTPEPRRKPTFRELLLQARPAPFPVASSTSSSSSSSKDDEKNRKTGSQRSKSRLPGPGLPDLTKVKAFVADGSQGVTYGPGTWHSPMVVLGDRTIDFVVLQYANGVAVEDCQEVEVASRIESGELVVSIPPALLGELKAKL